MAMGGGSYHFEQQLGEGVWGLRCETKHYRFAHTSRKPAPLSHGENLKTFMKFLLLW